MSDAAPAAPELDAAPAARGLRVSSELDAAAAASMPDAAPAAPELDATPAEGGLMVPTDFDAKARESLAGDDEKIAAMQKVANELRAFGELTAAHHLDRRVKELTKLRSQVDRSVALHLRTQRLKRRAGDAESREAARQESIRNKALDKMVKLKQAEAETAKAAAKVVATEEKAAARDAMAEAKAEKAAAKKDAEDRRQLIQFCHKHFAAWLVKHVRAVLASEDGKTILKGIERVVPDLVKRKVWKENSDCPGPWPSLGRASYIPVDTEPRLSADAPKAKEKHYASEAMALLLFGGKMPKDAKTGESIPSRLGKLLRDVFPHFDELLKSRMNPEQLLRKHSNSVDNAFFEAAWHYSRILGKAVFPCGVFKWPPAMSWMIEVREAAEVEKRHRDARTAVSASTPRFERAPIAWKSAAPAADKTMPAPATKTKSVAPAAAKIKSPVPAAVDLGGSSCVGGASSSSAGMGPKASASGVAVAPAAGSGGAVALAAGSSLGKPKSHKSKADSILGIKRLKTSVRPVPPVVAKETVPPPAKTSAPCVPPVVAKAEVPPPAKTSAPSVPPVVAKAKVPPPVASSKAKATAVSSAAFAARMADGF